MKYVLAVQDLQFGSTGKGQIAGSLAHVWYPDTVVTAWGPNAGHTFRKDGQKWVHTMLATSAVAPSVEQILIGPGSVINVDNLATEINAAKAYLRGKRLVIHPQAAVVQEGHRLDEARDLLRIGSTMKGTGAALCDKVMRMPVTVRDNADEIINKIGRAAMEADMMLSVSSRIYDQAIDMSEKMVVEGAQGFSLGVHTDFYPHTTSRDVSTAQLLADCRIPFPGRGNQLRTVGVCRTYPIRVANRPNLVGGGEFSSGGCYSDQKELDWSGDLNRPPEMTTVTKLPRRVFSFSHDQIIESCRIMNPDSIALTFCDYLEDPAVTEGEGPRVAMSESVRAHVRGIETVTGKPVQLLSYGPNMNDVHERALMSEDETELAPLDGTFLAPRKKFPIFEGIASE
jgi:adenylosuccinate synthase